MGPGLTTAALLIKAKLIKRFFSRKPNKLDYYRVSIQRFQIHQNGLFCMEYNILYYDTITAVIHSYSSVLWGPNFDCCTVVSGVSTPDPSLLESRCCNLAFNRSRSANATRDPSATSVISRKTPARSMSALNLVDK